MERGTRLTSALSLKSKRTAFKVRKGTTGTTVGSKMETVAPSSIIPHKDEVSREEANGAK
jgi:hypothetical protein